MIIMIAIRCNGCGLELKDTRGFKSHCISKHDGQDPGYTRLDEEMKQDEPQETNQDEPQEIKQEEESITSTSDDTPNSVEKSDPVSTVRIINGEGKKNREWIDKIIEQIVTPENIALAGAALVAFLNSKVSSQQSTVVGDNTLTDLYGNVHDF